MRRIFLFLQQETQIQHVQTVAHWMPVIRLKLLNQKYGTLDFHSDYVESLKHLHLPTQSRRLP